MKLSRPEFLKYINAKSKDLPPVKERTRQLLAKGASSLVLTDGHHQVLLATDHKSAQNIEGCVELIQQFKDVETIGPAPESLLIPKLIAVDLDVGELVNPKDPKSGLTSLKKNHFIAASEHPLKKNVVYQLPKMDGNLEDLLGKRFKEDTVELVEKCLTQCLHYLHNLGLSHNDIAFRNILYKGEYPNIEIKLTDLGACTLNVEKLENKDQLKKHHILAANDFRAMHHLIDVMRENLQKQPPTPEKRPPSPRKTLPRRQATRAFFNQMEKVKIDLYGAKSSEEDFCSDAGFPIHKPSIRLSPEKVLTAFEKPVHHLGKSLNPMPSSEDVEEELIKTKPKRSKRSRR